MKAFVFESTTDLLALLGSAIGSAILTTAGLLTEFAGLQNVLAGQAALGVWEAWVGGILLFAGVYLLGYQQFWRRLQLLGSPD